MTVVEQLVALMKTIITDQAQITKFEEGLKQMKLDTPMPPASAGPAATQGVDCYVFN